MRSQDGPSDYTMHSPTRRCGETSPGRGALPAAMTGRANVSASRQTSHSPSVDSCYDSDDEVVAHVEPTPWVGPGTGLDPGPWVQFALKLGYSEGQLERALVRLTVNERPVEANDLLAELITIGDDPPGDDLPEDGPPGDGPPGDGPPGDGPPGDGSQMLAQPTRTDMTDDPPTPSHTAGVASHVTDDPPTPSHTAGVASHVTDDPPTPSHTAGVASHVTDDPPTPSHTAGVASHANPDNLRPIVIDGSNVAMRSV